MKTGFIVGALVVVAGVYLVHQNVENRARERERLEQRKLLRDETRSAIVSMTSSHNAVVDWEATLVDGGVYRANPVLTLELERLWQTERPILFVGDVSDIASKGIDHYSVSIGPGLLTSNYTIATELRLQLTAPKSLIDGVLRQYPSAFANEPIGYSLAVVAKIDRIMTATDRTYDGVNADSRIGEGRLIDLVVIDHSKLNTSDIDEILPRGVAGR